MSNSTLFSSGTLLSGPLLILPGGTPAGERLVAWEEDDGAVPAAATAAEEAVTAAVTAAEEEDGSLRPMGDSPSAAPEEEVSRGGDTMPDERRPHPTAVTPSGDDNEAFAGVALLGGAAIVTSVAIVTSEEGSADAPTLDFVATLERRL